MWAFKSILISFLFIAIEELYAAEICSTQCKCVNESHFVKIHCDFVENKEYILDDRLSLPLRGNALNITLGGRTRLTIAKGFFKSPNRINSLIVQGAYENFENSDSHCLLKKQALDGIGGNFPEISFKNLKSVVLSEEALQGQLEINLIAEGIWQFTANKEVFGSTTFNASFNEIADLVLDEGVLATKSLNLTKPKIFINRSWIRSLQPMRGKKLTELRIENSEIERIKSSAFNILELHSLILDNVTIQTIESDIFREAVALENLAVINCRIENIEKRAIHDVGITKFTFERNLVNSIENNAMEFVSSTISIANNKINLLGSEWLKSIQWQRVNVLNNTFGSFDSISLENPTLDNVQCAIHHNSFTKVQTNAFGSISEKCRYSELIFKQNCACDFHSWLEKLFSKSSSIKQLSSESFCSLDSNDPLVRCLKAENVKYDQYHSEICSKKKSKLKCDRVKVEKIDAKFIDDKVLSDEIDWMDYINYIIAGCVCILLIPCLCLTVILTRKSRAVASDHYSQGTMQYQTDLLQLNQTEGPPSYEASIRSTKAFSNRDRAIIKQTLDTMRQKQPTDKYELVYTHTKRLMQEQVSEYEKVRIIGDIVQTIGECENSGEDFVAFTDILYKHLAPDATISTRNTTVQRLQAPTDGLYSEPILAQSIQNPSKANSEHIYAEPTALTQKQTMMPLLLTTNYSNPLDTHLNNNNLYSEPVIQGLGAGSSSFKPKVATPYAISASIEHQTLQANLPDIVNKNESSTSNARQDLNRITRSPTTNRKIPEYTVPSTSQKAPVIVTQETIEDWSDESMANSQSSNHSGGSNATVKIDEIVENAS